jgi:uncharacterized membrane protein
MSIDVIGTLHVLAAGAALGAGTAVAVARKGTLWHRNTGRAFGIAMLVLNLTALAIYDLTGRVNLFHAFALLSLVGLGLGWRAARRRGPAWRLAHANWMLWSYVGLLAAALSEVATRLPIARASWTHFSIAVGLATGLVCAVGAVLIHRAVRRIR